MVTVLTSVAGLGDRSPGCAARRDRRARTCRPVSSQSFNSATAVMVFETLATPIGLSSVHFTLGSSFSQRSTGPAVRPLGHDLALRAKPQRHSRRAAFHRTARWTIRPHFLKSCAPISGASGHPVERVVLLVPGPQSFSPRDDSASLVHQPPLVRQIQVPEVVKQTQWTVSPFSRQSSRTLARAGGTLPQSDAGLVEKQDPSTVGAKGDRAERAPPPLTTSCILWKRGCRDTALSPVAVLIPKHGPAAGRGKGGDLKVFLPVCSSASFCKRAGRHCWCRSRLPSSSTTQSPAGVKATPVKRVPLAFAARSVPWRPTHPDRWSRRRCPGPG